MLECLLFIHSKWNSVSPTGKLKSVKLTKIRIGGVPRLAVDALLVVANCTTQTAFGSVCLLTPFPSTEVASQQSPPPPTSAGERVKATSSSTLDVECSAQFDGGFNELQELVVYDQQCRIQELEVDTAEQARALEILELRLQVDQLSRTR